MKTFNKSAISVWMMGAATGVLLIASCKGKDYKETDETPVATVSLDSNQAKMRADSMANATTTTVIDSPPPPLSTALAGRLKPNPAKKHRKGTVVYTTDRNWEDQYNKMTIQINNQGIYNRAEIRPSYPGGEQALAKFIRDNINYPEQAIDEGVEGTVEVQFAVDEHGKVYTPMVKGERAGYGLDEEAARVVAKMPTWNPGQIKGKNVKSYYTLPITFRLD